MEGAHCTIGPTGLHEGEHTPLGPSVGFSNGKKGSNSLIYKLFSRQPYKSLRQEMEARREAGPFETELDSNDSDLIVTQCPYIRPLQNKLLPRTEVSSRLLRYQRSAPILNSGFADAQPSHEIPYGNAVITGQHLTEDAAKITSRESKVQLQTATLHEDVVAAAAYDFSQLRAWSYYIKCYSEGRFNIVSPPDPPPTKSSFSFLPAVNPVNETERLAAYENCNHEWNDWTCTRARDLVFDALLKFDAPWAAISFFDHDSELVIAELGYNRQIIPRRESIAAHVLFSTDSMVISDLQKDWRFAGNPLVSEQRKIRFFAGVPLLSEDGQAVGVFAIFGPNPRDKFTVLQRHDLFEFGILAARDLVLNPRQAPVDDKRRETPLLQREDLINGISNFSESPKSIHQRPAKSPISRLSPVRYGKQHGKTRKRSREAVSYSSEPTPPSSDESDGASDASSKGSATTIKHVSIYPRTQDDLGGEEGIRNSLTCPPTSPRPFSSSDLTSVEDMARFCTPEPDSEMYDDIFHPRDATATCGKASAKPSDLKQDQKSSDLVCLIAQESGQSVPPILGYMGEIETLQEDIVTIDTSSLDDISRFDTLNGPKPVSPQNRRGSMSSISTNITVSDVETFDSQVEAEFAAAFWAQNLGFDTIYAVEIFPNRPFMTDEELKAPGGMGSRLVVSYGLGDDVSFTMSMHLQALRTAGGVIWDDDGNYPGEYRRGFMMALAHDKAVLQNRSKGLVFGAFRKTPKDGNPAAIITTSDIERLRESAIVLKRILLKPLKDRQRYCQTEPSSPSGFPADEAIEIGKHSLDAGRKRMGDITKAVLIRQV